MEEINLEEKEKEIETCYKEACDKALELNQALIKLRNIKLPKFQSEEEMKKTFELAQSLNARTAYLLRSLLVQHGNVLFI